ncbi:MAG TPA: hypothetical protein V6C76_02995 [Drouetiella sp.]
MKKLVFAATITCLSYFAQSVVARNPDKPIPDVGHRSTSIPTIPIVTPGQTPPGGSNPGSSNKLSVGLFDANCDNVGKAQIRNETVTVNGHHQMVVREEAQSNVNNANQPSALCAIQNLDQLPYLKPLSFQINGGQMFVVQVEYVTAGNTVVQQFATPSGLLAKFNPNLTLMGSNTYSIPLGTRSNQIPANSQMQQIRFVTFGNPSTLCTNYTTDIYNVSFNGASVPLSMSSHHSCGDNCR